MILDVYRSAKGNYVAVYFNGNALKRFEREGKLPVVGDFVACERDESDFVHKVEDWILTQDLKNPTLVSSPRSELGEVGAGKEFGRIRLSQRLKTAGVKFRLAS